MRIPSSISSSDLTLATATLRPHRRPSREAAVCPAPARPTESAAATTGSLIRWPAGGLFAALFVVCFHFLVVTVMVPVPLADQPLRSKVLALTEVRRPALIVAGDSRAQVHVRPEVLAEHLGWSDIVAVNIGMPVCEPSTVLAAYREFSDRFASRPIMVLSVSFFAANDGLQDDNFVRDESVWSMNLAERFRMLPWKRAVASLFLPEQALARAITHGRHVSGNRVVPELGFVSKPPGGNERFSSQAVARQMTEVDRCWFGAPQIDGVRWRGLTEDLEALRDLGVQVVLLDSPVHPLFWSGVAGAPASEIYQRFRRKLAALGEQLDMPVLQYDCRALGGLDPDHAFFNLTHLSRDGATYLSERIAVDIQALISHGRIVAPPVSIVDARS